MLGGLGKLVGRNRRIVMFLAIATLGGGALVVCLARSPAHGAEKLSSDNYSLLSTDDPNFLARESNNFSGRELFFKMMFSVLLVVVLGGVAIYISRRFLPRIANLPGKEIHVLETAHLGPHKAVHLLKIGNQRFLIGSTTENITKLAELTEVFTEVSAPQMDDNVSL